MSHWIVVDLLLDYPKIDKFEPDCTTEGFDLSEGPWKVVTFM